jgi:hypothetical protein
MANTEAVAKRMLPYEGDVVMLLLLAVVVICFVVLYTTIDSMNAMPIVNLSSDQSWLLYCVAGCYHRCYHCRLAINDSSQNTFHFQSC